MDKAYYWAHREQCKLVAQRISMRLKLTVFQHYSGNPPYCEMCGEKDILVLCLDHIHGGGEKHRRSLGVIGGVQFYRKLRNAGYPKGYQVLCANCNLRKEMLKMGWGDIMKKTKINAIYARKNQRRKVHIVEVDTDSQSPSLVSICGQNGGWELTTNSLTLREDLCGSCGRFAPHYEIVGIKED